MPERPDVLAGLSAAARRPVRHLGTAEAIAVRNVVFAENPALVPLNMHLYRAGEVVACVICARVEIDHPIYFADNRFADCADCGCRLQYRPHGPQGTRLCICCAARRQRETADG